MRASTSLIMLVFAFTLSGQSKSITRFREKHPESNNMFFYSSTLKMLNSENNPELADLLGNIEEIRVLNYEKGKQKLSSDDVARLKNALADEDYVNLMMTHEKGNAIGLYSRQKRGRTVGFVAVVESAESLVLIDLIGSIDVKKFLELKKKLDTRLDDRT